MVRLGYGFILPAKNFATEFEGDAHLLGLGNRIACLKLEKTGGTISKMPVEYTTFFEGTTGDFLYFQTEVFTSDKMEVAFLNSTC